MQLVAKAEGYLGRYYLILAILLFAILALLFSPSFAELYYKDEVAYLAAAERYARGDFANAPNSLWGPLISWLVAVPISFGIKSVLSARIISHALGIITLFAADRLAQTLCLPVPQRAAFMIILAPYMVYFATLGLCAEPALTAILTWEFAILFDRNFPVRRHAGLLCGVLGGLGYFAKGFGLPFFLGHYTLCCAIIYLARPDASLRRNVIRHFALGLSIFAIMAAGWIFVLYEKYGEITPGITGKYNYQIVGPGKVDRPTMQMGFVGPPEGTSVSIWEDPAYLYRVPSAVRCCLSDWSPFESAASFRHQLGLIQLNVTRTVTSFLRFSVFSPVLLGGALLFLVMPLLPASSRRTPGRKRATNPAKMPWLAAISDGRRLQLILILVTIALFSVPYVTVFSDERLLWPMLVLLAAVAMILHVELAAAVPRHRRLYWCGLVIVSLSFVVLPLKKLTANLAPRRATASVVESLKGAKLTSIRFASNDDYGTSMIAGYYLNAQYFGQPAPGMSEEDILSELRRQRIRYYFVWDKPLERRAGMTLLHRFHAGYRWLSVYRID